MSSLSFNNMVVAGGIWLRSMIGRLVFQPMSWRMKRMIFVASVLGVLKQIRDPSDMQLVKRLNDLMTITRDPNLSGFSVPMRIKSFIWKDALQNRVRICGEEMCVTDLGGRALTEDDIKAIGDFFYEKTPTWLRYGSRNLMANEAALLVENFA